MIKSLDDNEASSATLATPPMKQCVLRIVATLACAACSTGRCAGVDFSLSLRKLDQSALGVLREVEEAEPEAALVKPPPPRTKRMVTLGLAREVDQNGDSASMTPFLVDVEQGKWQYHLSGTGYTWARSGEERKQGIADVSALVAYAYKVSKGIALIPALELTFPTHGEVGSKGLSEDVRLSVVFNASKTWSWSLAGLVARVERAPPSASRYTQGVAGKVVYSWNDDTSAFVSLNRTYSRGKGGSSVVVAEVDFPLPHKIFGSLSASQGLTSAKRDKIVEFDLTYSF